MSTESNTVTEETNVVDTTQKPPLPPMPKNKVVEAIKEIEEEEVVRPKTRKRRRSILKRKGSFIRKTKKKVHFTSHVEVQYTPTYYLRNDLPLFYKVHGVLKNRFVQVILVVFPFLLLSLCVLAISLNYKVPKCGDIFQLKPIIPIISHLVSFSLLFLVAFTFVGKEYGVQLLYYAMVEKEKKKVIDLLEARKRNRRASFISRRRELRLNPFKQKDPILRNKNEEFVVDKEREMNQLSQSGFEHLNDELDVKRRKKLESLMQFKGKTIRDSIYIAKGKQLLTKEDSFYENDDGVLTYASDIEEEVLIRQIKSGEKMLEPMTKRTFSRFQKRMAAATKIFNITLFMFLAFSHIGPIVTLPSLFVMYSCQVVAPFLYYLTVFFEVFWLMLVVVEATLAILSLLPIRGIFYAENM